MLFVKSKIRIDNNVFIFSSEVSTEPLEGDPNTPGTSEGVGPPWDHDWTLNEGNTETTLKEGDRGSWPLEERTPPILMEVQ